VWVATQEDIDPDMCHVGFIMRRVTDEDSEPFEGFLDQVHDLTSEQAEWVTNHLHRLIREDPHHNPDNAFKFAHWLGELDEPSRVSFLAQNLQVDGKELPSEHVVRSGLEFDLDLWDFRLY
jgi:hypothetical protein